MRKCPNKCRVYYPEGEDMFCYVCGKKLIKFEDVKCDCGKKVMYCDKFCPKCGKEKKE